MSINPDTTLTIPELAIEVSGKVVSSSLTEFAEAFRAGLAELNTELSTDEEFGQAELDVKQLKTIETALTDAKSRALEQAEEVNRLFDSIDELSDEAREARLKMERQIKKRKEEVKSELIADGVSRIEADERKVFRTAFEDAIKGKRNLRSMAEACLKVVSSTNARIKQARELIEAAEKETPGLVPDVRQLEIYPIEKLESELQRRKDVKTAKDAKEKAEAEAKLAREEAEKAKADAEEARKPAPLPPAPQEKKGQTAREVSEEQLNESEKIQIAQAKEWENFEGRVKAVFASLKHDKERLIFDANQKRAAKFAAGVNEAWKGVA